MTDDKLQEIESAATSAALHAPCCKAHGKPLTCEQYRRAHFVEVRPCCEHDAIVMLVAEVRRLHATLARVTAIAERGCECDCYEDHVSQDAVAQHDEYCDICYPCRVADAVMKK